MSNSQWIAEPQRLHEEVHQKIVELRTEQILRIIQKNPGIRKTILRAVIKCQNKDFISILESLESSGKIQTRTQKAWVGRPRTILYPNDNKSSSTEGNE